jgi:hypothetical protein
MKPSVLKLSIVTLLFVGFYTSYGQNRNQVRQPAVSGTFYPATNNQLKNKLDQLFASVENKTTNENIGAIIVPDAGIEYSGQATAAAIAKLDREKSYLRIFVIGTSHSEPFDGASIYNKGDYRTPLGNVKVDNEVVDRLIYRGRKIKYSKKAHKDEHSIEVQLPYLQYWLNKPFKIVPIIIGTPTSETSKELVEMLEPFFTPENLFVISNDFSKIKSSDEVGRLSMVSAITGNSPDKVIEFISPNSSVNADLETRPGSLSSLLTLLDITSLKENIEIEHIKSTKHEDITTGRNQEVEYQSYIVVNNIKQTDFQINLTNEDKQFLLQLVRETINQKLDDNTIPDVNEDELSENLKIKCGAFVTLTNEEEVRGNIGKFTATEPLYKIVQEMAVASAFRDARYAPITKNEFRDIDIEISVITPLKQIFSSDEFQLGRHGIYMILDGRSGTFLPQVARTTGWDKEEFLGYCANDKAGIGWDGWRNADLFTFEAVVFDRRNALRR